MYTVKCLNPISKQGLDLFTSEFEVIDDLNAADAVLVRSAKCTVWKFRKACWQ